MLVVVMGVSGTGKTVVGRMLAVNLEVPFLDADDFHEQEHLEQMRRGESLSDSERWPWLDRLNLELRREAALPFHGAVLACSALKAGIAIASPRACPISASSI
ncbi:MAG: gluconokinase [Acidimicrobiales bacterium]